MHNPRITRKEYGLIKGALRRIFSRSELRKKVLDRYTIDHSDDRRPRVGKWCWCTSCGEVTPRYKLEMDHLEPIIALNETVYDLSLDELANRIWCEEENLKPSCKSCHLAKTRWENKERRKLNGKRR